MNRWNYDEFSAMVYPCPMPAGCLGGRFHACAVGYTGEFCAQCAEGYYMLNGASCKMCDSDSSLIILYVCQVRACWRWLAAWSPTWCAILRRVECA